MADKLNGVFISEILADNAGGSAIDTDGDGNTNKSDEFIELQNTSGTTVSLDGYEVWSEKNGLLYSFGASDTIAPGDTATIVGNYSGTVPSGYYDGGVSEGTNWIPDGEGQKFDSIFLVDTNTGDYIVLSYGNPPRAPTLPTGFSGTNQVGAGETIDSNAPNGTAFARDANGDLVETTPTPDTPNIPCFVKGTRILTKRGDVPVEGLALGEHVLTKDAGFLPLRAVGCFQITRRDLLRNPDLAPVCFPAGSLGNDRDLLLSASHRVLLEDPQAELMFGDAEVLASGRQCLGHIGAYAVRMPWPLIYYHLVFDTHAILRAEGAWVESLHLAELARESLDRPDCWRVADGTTLSSLQHPCSARRVMKRFEVQLLFASRPEVVSAPALRVA